MIPIAVCFLLANSTVFCPPTDMTQDEVQELFEDLTDLESEVNLFSGNREENDDSRLTNNDNDSEESNDNDNDSEELPSCQDDNRPRPGSCRDDLDRDEEPIEETNDDEEEKEEGE